jgi:hypothetical protein
MIFFLDGTHHGDFTSVGHGGHIDHIHVAHPAMVERRRAGQRS